MEPTTPTPEAPAASAPNPAPSAPTPQPTVANSASADVDNTTLNFFSFIISVLIHPIKTFRLERKKLGSTKNSLILGVIVVAAMTILSLVNSIANAIVVKGYEYDDNYKKHETTKVVWENLDDKRFNWVNHTIIPLIRYAAIVAAVALGFFIVGKILKKDISYQLALSVTASAAIPYILGYFIIAPLLGIFWSTGAYFARLAGEYLMYIVFIQIMTEVFGFEGDAKVFAFFFTLMALLIINYTAEYIYVKSQTSGGSYGDYDSYSLDDLMKYMNY
ncbi:MAG: YIP1 family protein [Candidatus Saccharibacteria bacterium]|nr:YIP1 family protein [Candidatus Saccharibacteria bacterium]